MNRVAQHKDTAQIIALWQAVFGDEEAYIRRCLDQFAGEGQVYVAEEAGEIVSFLLAVPCFAGDADGRYYYALATKESHRGRGLMGGLLQYAEQAEQQKGAVFSCLIPAEESLFAYYAKQGYSTCINLRRISRQIKRNLLAVAEFDTVTTSRLPQLRERFLKVPFIGFSNGKLADILSDLYSSGAETAETDNGYAVYFVNKDELLIAEMGAETNHAEYLMQAIRERTGCELAHITLPECSGLYNGEGRLVPYALVKSHTSDFKAEGYYLRFALDEIH